MYELVFNLRTQGYYLLLALLASASSLSALASLPGGGNWRGGVRRRLTSEVCLFG